MSVLISYQLCTSQCDIVVTTSQCDIVVTTGWYVGQNPVMVYGTASRFWDRANETPAFVPSVPSLAEIVMMFV